MALFVSSRVGSTLALALVLAGCRTNHGEREAEAVELPPIGSVSGTITADGAAIVGARVCASKLDRRVMAVREDVFTSICAKTDGSGGYALALDSGRWLVMAAAQDHLSAGAEVLVRASQPSASLVLDLRRGGRVHAGTLVDLAGAPITNAAVDTYVDVDAVGQSRWIGASTSTDARGRFELWASDDASLSTRAPGFAGLMVERDPGTYVALPESVIAGRVVDVTGEPVPAARVAFVNSLGLSYGFAFNATRTDAAGEFRLTALMPGAYELVALAGPGDHGAVGWVKEVYVGFASTHDEVEITLGESLRWLRARVVERGGEPVAGCMVNFSGEADERRLGAWIWSDAEGLLEVPVLPEQRYEITGVVCPGKVGTPPYDRLMFGETGDSIRAIEVVRGRVLRGRVLDAAGAPVVDEPVCVAARRPDDSDPLSRYHIGLFLGDEKARTDADGGFELGGLIPGPYDLSVGPWFKIDARPTVTITDAPMTEASFAMPPIEFEPKPVAEPPPEPPELAVRVVTLRGTPAANAVVGPAKGFCMGMGMAMGAAPERLDWSIAPPQIALTDAEGRATLEFGDSEGCPIAAARPGEVGLATIQPGQTGELVIRLRPSALRWNPALLFHD